MTVIASYIPMYDADNECLICGEHLAHPHAIGCINGDGFAYVPIAEAHAIAAERIRENGRIDTEFLSEFALIDAGRDIVVDGVLHARKGNGVLVHIAGLDDLLMVSMPTGDIIRLPRKDLLPFALDADGYTIETGDAVQVLADDMIGHVTHIDPDDNTVTVDFGPNKRPGVKLMSGCDIRVADLITVRWAATVVESHSEAFTVTDLAGALGITTEGKTPEQVREEVKAALDKHTDSDTDTDEDLREFNELLSAAEEEDTCDGAYTENRTLSDYDG